jgi:hypothetical protein
MKTTNAFTLIITALLLAPLEAAPSNDYVDAGVGSVDTMVAEQTNGAHGYVPTAKAFEGGSYETWFGEHSYLTTRAGEIIEKESLVILNRLKISE